MKSKKLLACLLAASLLVTPAYAGEWQATPETAPAVQELPAEEQEVLPSEETAETEPLSDGAATVVAEGEIPDYAALDPITDGQFNYSLSYVPGGIAANVTSLVNPDSEENRMLVIPSTVQGYKVISIAGGFAGNQTIRSVQLPDTLETIGKRAFQGCTNLTGTIVIPKSVKEIGGLYDGSGAFRETGITGVVIEGGGSSLKIDDNAFYGCKKLETVKLASHVSSIGNNAFRDCTALSTLTIEDGGQQKTIGDAAFQNTGIKTLDIPGTVTFLDKSAFRDCKLLQKVTFHEGLETIESSAFRDCVSLTGTITLPASLSQLGTRVTTESLNVFSNTAITGVNILNGNGTTSLLVGLGTFRQCKKLTTVTLPARTAEVCQEAFAECPKLSSLTMASGLFDLTIGDRAFQGCAIKTLTLPATTRRVGAGAFENCKSLTKLTLNEGLETIGDAAFRGCVNLGGQLTIPSSVTAIECVGNAQNAGAFCNTGITSVKVEPGVDELLIDSFAFKDCLNLRTVELTDRVTTINGSAFRNCPELYYFKWPGGNYQQKMGIWVFLECPSLYCVVLSKQLTKIDSTSFRDCTALKDVYYAGSAADWAKITIEDGNDPLLAATFHYLSNGPLTVPDPSKTYTGWKTVNGVDYWYENGVKQGTTGRGKEIYDPATNAWYWLDAPTGAKAVGKDVYQESMAGAWADRADGTGKWVRYDANGYMVKGWQTTGDGRYYFDKTYGTMAKGYATIDGREYFFDPASGKLVREVGAVPANGWKSIDGKDYWYENGVRQGFSVDASYRGKEIYDPASNAWYWLDNVQGGAKAVSKDVYQESDAGPWADRPDGTGKWVRYDAQGHMIKGWQRTGAGTYYFDPVYGTMAKGTAVIDGVTYSFDPNTGLLN